MSKEEKSSENNTDKAEEPSTAFKTVRVFNSFEEENEYTLRSYAQLTPEERLASVTRMRLAAHPYLDKNLKPWGMKIYFESK